MDEQELRRQLHAAGGDGLDRASVLDGARRVNARRARRRSQLAIGGVAAAVVLVTAGVGIGLSGAGPVHQPPAHTGVIAPTTGQSSTGQSSTGPSSTEPSSTSTSASTTEPSTTGSSATRGTSASGKPAMASAAGFAFVSPDGNVVCRATAGVDGTLTCGAKEFSYQPPESASTACASAPDGFRWGQLLSIDAGRTRMDCVGSMPTASTTLDDGHSVSNQRFWCTATASGVLCADRLTRTGFRLERTAYKFLEVTRGELDGLPPTPLTTRRVVVDEIAADAITVQDAAFAPPASAKYQGEVIVQPGRHRIAMAGSARLVAVGGLCRKAATLSAPVTCTPANDARTFSPADAPLVDLVVDGSGTVVAVSEVYRP